MVYTNLNTITLPLQKCGVGEIRLPTDDVCRCLLQYMQNIIRFPAGTDHSLVVCKQILTLNFCTGQIVVLRRSVAPRLLDF